MSIEIQIKPLFNGLNFEDSIEIVKRFSVFFLDSHYVNLLVVVESIRCVAF